MKINRLMI